VKLKRLYYASIAETISWIGLIVGMIMKYGFDNGSGTDLFGPIHGMLFVIYVGLTLLCHVEYKWPLKRTAIVLLAAIPPFVGFLVVHGLIKETQDETASASLAS
jgi:integral membrane protein